MEIGRGALPHFTPVRFSLHGAGLSCGRDVGLPVSAAYQDEFPFTGTIERVVVEVDGPEVIDAEEEAAGAIAQQ